MNGVQGRLPPLTTDPNGWEAAAKTVMGPRDCDYAKGGAGAGETIRKNRGAFQKWSIYSDKSGVARAAGALGIPCVLSTFASEDPEKVAAAQDSISTSGPGIRWLRLYWPQSVDPDVTGSILKRAKDTGYTALVITLDIFSLS
ncbi:hypothetical protein F4818DRAFT_437454 [Hypoxylon cercidicola]|nr:hypothetical protein F4818DRAFT_437454 [Hypoxylon cercidicola]